jgi:hypothetical protein
VAADGLGNVYVADEFNNRVVQLRDSAVPEPSSLTALGLGCAALAAWRRRRRNAEDDRGEAAPAPR